MLVTKQCHRRKTRPSPPQVRVRLAVGSGLGRQWQVRAGCACCGIEGWVTSRSSVSG